MRDRGAMADAARTSDGAIHLAAEFSAESAHLDRGVIDAVLAAFGDSGKPFIYTSGIWVMGDTGGEVADESTPVRPIPLVAWRPGHEQLVLRAGGIRGIVIRPAMVYGGGSGFLADFALAPDAGGVVRYVGQGENRWPFVHVDDLADLYVLALGAPAGSLYFASAGPSIPVIDVARAAAANGRVESIALEKARQAMGPLADAMVLDQIVSADKAMQELGWSPSRRSVLDEFAQRGADDARRQARKPNSRSTASPT